MEFIGTYFKPDILMCLSGYTGSKAATIVNFNLLLYDTWKRMYALFGELPPR